MAVQIITDSSADLSVLEQKEFDVEVLPLKIIFDMDEYLSGVTLSSAEFYDKLAVAAKIPTTSQPTIPEMTDAFEKHLNNGDEVVCVFISGRMSGTVQNAMVTRQQLEAEDRVHIVDSETVTFALGALVLEAVRLRDKGLPAKEIAGELDILKTKSRLYAMVDTLKYLQMGGRISGTQAIVGGILGIKPIITITDGLVENIGKERGKHKAFETVLKKARAAGIDHTRTKYVAHSNSPEMLAAFKDYAIENAPDINIEGFARCDIGSTVGVHIGPGAVGVAFFVK